jgi:hypothetical protein
MTPIASVLAGLQIIASWLMSALTVIAVILSVILCLAFVECVWEYGAVARAYTVKINSSVVNATVMRRRNKA